MAGGYYTALSGMRARMDALDRLASDIANSSTTGYKTERAGTVEAARPSFGAALQSAVDVASGRSQLDLRPGALATTGRPMDVAIEGKGFFAVQTAQGERYTRNGHLMRRTDGVLATDEGDAVLGPSGPIKVGTTPIEVDPDGTVRSGGGIVGTLKVVDFDPSVALTREGGSTFRAEGTPQAVAKPAIRSGTLEQSNVSIVDRVAELSEVSRSFEALSRALSVLMNDVDKGAITEFGRK